MNILLCLLKLVWVYFTNETTVTKTHMYLFVQGFILTDWSMHILMEMVATWLVNYAGQ